jgi:hypothetical protein
VVKARRPSRRIEPCFDVQQFMWATGYPCPQPLAGPAPLGSLTATAERLVSGGGELSQEADRAEHYAEALVDFIGSASRFPGRIDLRPPVPWMGWGHEGSDLWPEPDDLDANLNAYSEPAWLEEIGRRLRARLGADRNPLVAGHGDWWGPNVRWLNGHLHAVFDWDSLVYSSEAAVAGAAAAEFAEQWPVVTSFEDTERFISAYERARGRPWSADEREICWAAGLWLMAFNAKKQSLQRVFETLDHLNECGAEKLKRAGA